MTLATPLPLLAQDGAAPDLASIGLGRVEKTLKGERELRERIEGFFKSVEGGDTAGAFGALMKGSALGDNRESIDKLVADTSKIIETYGTMRAHELVGVNRVGSRLIRFTYLSYSDEFPLKWEIYCFFGKSGWQVLDFNVNNDFGELFDGPAARRQRPASGGGAARVGSAP